MPQRSLVDVFPQEIIERILDNFSGNPRRGRHALRHPPPMRWAHKDPVLALKACALVCRTFTPRCQYLLFSTLRLLSRDYKNHDLDEWNNRDDEHERNRRQNIYKMLLSKPHLINAVRHVSVDLGPSPSGMGSVIDEEDITNPGLPLLLRELPISSIEITNVYRHCRDETQYPNPLIIEYYFFRPFIQTTAITSLDISFVVINASILAYFPNLTELDLCDVEFEEFRDVDYKEIAVHQPRPRLEILRIAPPSLLEEVLRVCGSDALPLFDISHLRVLETPLSGDEEDILMLSRVFDICAQHLEELDIHWPDPAYLLGSERHSELPTTKSLESLKLGNMEGSWNIDNMGLFPKLTILYLWSGFMTVEENASPTTNSLTDYCHFLARISSPNTQLGRIEIDITISCPETLSPLCCLEAPGWDNLDDEVMRISNGKVLEFNLNIAWHIRKYRRSFGSIHDDANWGIIRETLKKVLIPAICEKLQLIKQSPWIDFNITANANTMTY